MKWSEFIKQIIYSSPEIRLKLYPYTIFPSQHISSIKSQDNFRPVRQLLEYLRHPFRDSQRHHSTPGIPIDNSIRYTQHFQLPSSDIPLQSDNLFKIKNPADIRVSNYHQPPSPLSFGRTIIIQPLFFCHQSKPVLLLPANKAMFSHCLPSNPQGIKRSTYPSSSQ